jgi:hypothetical protein
MAEINGSEPLVSKYLRKINTLFFCRKLMDYPIDAWRTKTRATPITGPHLLRTFLPGKQDIIIYQEKLESVSKLENSMGSHNVRNH